MSLVATRAPAEADELALFHRTLAELCRAEVALPEAFRSLQSELRAGRFKRAIADLASEVESGVPLGDAYASRREQFPPLYCALVEAGMVSGDLPGVLDEISQHAAARAAVRHRLQRALAYPLVTALFVLGLGAFAFLVSDGPLAGFRDATGAESALPWVAGSLGGLALFVLGAVVVAWRRNPLGFRLPVLGRLRLGAARASFAATLALLTRRRVPLATAFSLAAEASDDAAVRQRVLRMKEAAENGAGLTEAVHRGKLIERSLLWLLQAAEQNGTAPVALDDIAGIHRRRLDRDVERLATLVTPLAEIVVGVVVFLIAYSVLIPLYVRLQELANL